MPQSLADSCCWSALRANFHKCFSKWFTALRLHVLCANFVKLADQKLVKSRVAYQTKKISARSVALASACIAPKICHSQLQTMYSECPKFLPNRFTSGGVIAERVNTIQTHHKVFPILSEASSLSNKIPIIFSSHLISKQYNNSIDIKFTKVVLLKLEKWWAFGGLKSLWLHHCSWIIEGTSHQMLYMCSCNKFTFYD